MEIYLFLDTLHLTVNAQKKLKKELASPGRHVDTVEQGHFLSAHTVCKNPTLFASP